MLFSRDAFHNAYEALGNQSPSTGSVRSERLEAYSDAVLAIIATILVVPLVRYALPLLRKFLLFKLKSYSCVD